MTTMKVRLYDIEYSDKLAKFDIHSLKFEYTWHVRYRIWPNSAIFDIWSVLVPTVYSKLRVHILNILLLSPYSICQIASKFDFRHCSFEYRYVTSNIPMNIRIHPPNISTSHPKNTPTMGSPNAQARNHRDAPPGNRSSPRLKNIAPKNYYPPAGWLSPSLQEGLLPSQRGGTNAAGPCWRTPGSFLVLRHPCG
jgi:hypothetical protein